MFDLFIKHFKQSNICWDLQRRQGNSLNALHRQTIGQTLLCFLLEHFFVSKSCPVCYLLVLSKHFLDKAFHGLLFNLTWEFVE